jgi:hypothetical protein
LTGLLARFPGYTLATLRDESTELLYLLDIAGYGLAEHPMGGEYDV